MLTSGKLTNITKLQNIISRQTRHIGYRLVQSHQQKRERDMREHDSQESLMMNLNKSLFDLIYPESNVYKTH